MDTMNDGQYRWDEISAGRKAFWIVSLAIMFLIAIGVVVHGRVVLGEKGNLETVRSRERENTNRTAANRNAVAAKEKSDKQAFDLTVSNLYSIPGLRGAGGRVNGKMVVLDKKEKRIDSVNSQLPTNLRATTLDELGTVVWLEWAEHQTGTYTTGGAAYYYTCQVTVIDRSIPARIATRSFRGGPAPTTTTSSYYGQNHYGSRPDDEIVQYLKSLAGR